MRQTLGGVHVADRWMACGMTEKIIQLGLLDAADLAGLAEPSSAGLSVWGPRGEEGGAQGCCLRVSIAGGRGHHNPG
jgi:hypothetical protein